MMDAMLVTMALHDLGKVDAWARAVCHAVRAPVSEDHDEVLLLAMQRLPEALPSFVCYFY
jgi:hypothetical protein